MSRRPRIAVGAVLALLAAATTAEPVIIHFANYERDPVSSAVTVDVGAPDVPIAWSAMQLKSVVQPVFTPTTVSETRRM